MFFKCFILHLTTVRVTKGLFQVMLNIHCVQKKNTHSSFLLYLAGKCLDLYQIFRECLRWIKYSIDIKVKIFIATGDEILTSYLHVCTTFCLFNIFSVSFVSCCTSSLHDASSSSVMMSFQPVSSFSAVFFLQVFCSVSSKLSWMRFPVSSIT